MFAGDTRSPQIPARQIPARRSPPPRFPQRKKRKTSTGLLSVESLQLFPGYPSNTAILYRESDSIPVYRHDQFSDLFTT